MSSAKMATSPKGRYEFFKENLKKFQPYEEEAGKLIEKIKNVKIISYNNNNEYDFITSDNIKYEVKAEPMSLKTNNYFIEYHGYGKQSGINATKAEYYIITNTINYYLIETSKLKELTEIHGKIRTTKDKLTYGYIIKCNIIHDNAEELTII